MSRAGLPHMVPLERLGAAGSGPESRRQSCGDTSRAADGGRGILHLQQGALTPQFSGSPAPPEVLRPRGPSSCSGYS